MNFTPRAQKAFQLADLEARSLGHPCIGSQHLVLGLFLLGNGVQFSVLSRLGFTTESLRQGIMALGSAPEQTEIVNGFALGSAALRALERADSERIAMSHTYIGTEHVLLSLLAEETGRAANLFAAHEVDTAKARQIILDEYAHA